MSLLSLHFQQQGQIYTFIKCLVIIDFAFVIFPISIFSFPKSISSAYKHAVVFLHLNTKTFQGPTSPSSYSAVSLQFFIANPFKEFSIYAASTSSLHFLCFTYPIQCFCPHHSDDNIRVLGTSEVYLAKSNGHFSVLRLSVFPAALSQSIVSFFFLKLFTWVLCQNQILDFLTLSLSPSPNLFLPKSSPSHPCCY